MDTADQTLWESWRARRDEAAFETLVRPHLRFAMDLARRTGLSTADAEDVVQDALVRLAREEGERPVEVGLRAWLGRVVSLRSRMLRREEARRRRREGRPPPSAGLDVPPGALDDAVERALSELPEPQREAVTLHFLHDLDYAEVAHVLGVSENACRIRAHRGIQRLRARLGEKAPAALAALPISASPANPEALVASALSNGASPLVALGALGGAVVVNKVAFLVIAIVAAGAGTTFALNRPGEPTPEPVEPAAAEQAAVEHGGGTQVRGAAKAAHVAPPPSPSPAPSPAEEPQAARQARLIAAIYAGRGRIGVGRAGTRARDVQWLESAPEDLAGRVVLAVAARSGGSAAWIADLALLPDLALLRLSRNSPLDLSRLPVMPHLEEVELDRLPTTRETMFALERQPSLSVLALGNTSLDDEAMRALVGIARLTSLSLRDTKFAESSLPMFASLPRLRSLHLDRAEVTDAGLAPLASLSGLEHLDLSGTHISGSGLEALAGLPNLKRLVLEKSRVTDDGVRSIAAMRGVEAVDLEETGLTDAGVAALVTGHLVELNLSKTRITDAVFESLARIPTLRKVDVGNTKVTKDGIEGFKARRPEVRVRD